MARKYHQSRKDREDERRGMEHRYDGNRKNERNENDKYYQGRKDREDERRGMERSRHEKRGGLDDGYMGMISEDHAAPANLPQHIIHHYYPKGDYMDMHYLDDTISGIDENRDDSVRTIDHHQSDSMY